MKLWHWVIIAIVAWIAYRLYSGESIVPSLPSAGSAAAS